MKPKQKPKSAVRIQKQAKKAARKAARKAAKKTKQTKKLAKGRPAPAARRKPEPTRRKPPAGPGPSSPGKPAPARKAAPRPAASPVEQQGTGGRQRVLDDHRQIRELLATIAGDGPAAERVACLERLEPVLVRHFQEEEDQVEGVHRDVASRAPQQLEALRGLAVEHRQLLATVRQLLDRCRQAAGPDPELRRLGTELQQQIAAHEAKETDLFLDSIWTDFGEGD